MENSTYLFWLDLEMTGVDAQQHHILEIAAIITDANLNIIKEGPSFAIQQPSEHLETMDAYVRDMHTNSGLLNRVAQSNTPLGLAEREMISFFHHYCVQGITPLCGNSIWVDRSFLRRYMPHLDACFHYRMIDVSTLKELAKRWYPNIPSFEKQKNHVALADIYESIAELSYYRKVLLK